MLGRLAKNSSAIFGGQLASVAIALVQSVIVARVLGPEQFGKWALLLSSSALAMNFLAFRTAESLTCFWIEARENGDAASMQLYLSSALVVECVTKLAAGFATFIIGTAFLGSSTATAGSIALVSLYRFLSFPDAAWMSLLRDQQRIKALSFVPTTQAIVQLAIIAMLFSVFRGSLFLVAISYLAPQIIFCSIKLSQAQSTAHAAGTSLFLSSNLKLLKPEWRSGFWRMMSAGYLTSCLSSLMKEGDTLVVGLVTSDTSVGFYRLARSLVSVVQLATQALATLILQDFAELRRKGPAAIMSVVHRVAGPFAAVVIAGSTIISIILPYVVDAVYGSEYQGAVLPFRILIVGTAISTSLFWVTPALLALREVKAMLYISFVNFAAYVASMAIGVHLLGGIGPAVATSTAWTVGYGVSLAWLIVILRRDNGKEKS